jgi:hypothetical protein
LAVHAARTLATAMVEAAQGTRIRGFDSVFIPRVHRINIVPPTLIGWFRRDWKLFWKVRIRGEKSLTFRQNDDSGAAKFQTPFFKHHYVCNTRKRHTKAFLRTNFSVIFVPFLLWFTNTLRITGAAGGRGVCRQGAEKPRLSVAWAQRFGICATAVAETAAFMEVRGSIADHGVHERI